MAGPRSFLRERSKRCKWITAVVVAFVVVVLVVAIPLGVILPRKRHSSHLPSTLLMPLYIYPDAGDYDPLYTAITAHPNLNFTIILNPNSGPGQNQYPADEFLAPFKKLNAYANVQTLGYVSTNYTMRNISAVLRDVAVYSGWASEPSAVTPSSASLAVGGIFFDEAVGTYTPEAAQYMETINAAVKNATGFTGRKTIIHNPGIIPDAQLVQANTDITVVFENSYDSYLTKEAALSILPRARSAYSQIVHSLPTSWDDNALGDFIGSISQHAEYLFVTNLHANYYESFGPNWRSFAEIMAS